MFMSKFVIKVRRRFEIHKVSFFIYICNGHSVSEITITSQDGVSFFMLNSSENNHHQPILC